MYGELCVLEKEGWKQMEEFSDFVSYIEEKLNDETKDECDEKVMHSMHIMKEFLKNTSTKV